MQQRLCVGFSPSISCETRRSFQDFLKMFLTKPTVNWRSIEKSDALTVVATWIGAHSFAQRLLLQESSVARPDLWSASSRKPNCVDPEATRLDTSASGLRFLAFLLSIALSAFVHGIGEFQP